MNNTNIGQAFPLEHLASDIARSNYNYQSILNGLVEWNNSDNDTVTIRLTKDVDPYFQDYVIPSKKSVCADNSVSSKILNESILPNSVSESSRINQLFYGGSFVNIPPWSPDSSDLGDLITFRLTVVNNGGSSWKLCYLPHVEEWVSGGNYRYGNLVTDPLDNNNVYKLVDNETNSVGHPQINPNYAFVGPTALEPQDITEISEFSSSIICKVRMTVDVDGFILKNNSQISSSNTTNITMLISMKGQETPSIYDRNVDVFKTANYATWPDNVTPAWTLGNEIQPTNTSISIKRKQAYSAAMVFNHADMERCKTVNFINYEGPDLDQGLCIYLPVEVPVNLGVAKPEDGFTYDFYFRIWPNPNYTRGVTRDHIINKSQIYVYSSPDMDSIANEELDLNEPIAKFSMSRMTNFYMFGENVSIPDKPVCYRATFIFSQIQNKWVCLDYYQLPDHVFIGPVGFVDPQNPGNVDINNDVIGTVNPNAKFVGYETGAFPTFADPFANTNLTPFRANDQQASDFFNRIIS